MISAIVLAAGRSRRLPPQKLLLPLDHRPVICVVVDELLASQVDEVLVVVGADGDAIRTALTGREVRFVKNPDWQSEMLASVRCGLNAVGPDCQAVLLVLGDQPVISNAVVDGLISAFRAGKKGIVVPTFDSRRGHPILVSTAYRPEVLAGYDEVGLRGLVHAHQDDVAEVAAPSSNVLQDMDTLSDYRRLQERGGA